MVTTKIGFWKYKWTVGPSNKKREKIAVDYLFNFRWHFVLCRKQWMPQRTTPVAKKNWRLWCPMPNNGRPNFPETKCSTMFQLDNFYIHFVSVHLKCISAKCHRTRCRSYHICALCTQRMYCERTAVWTIDNYTYDMPNLYLSDSIFKLNGMESTKSIAFHVYILLVAFAHWIHSPNDFGRRHRRPSS